MRVTLYFVLALLAAIATHADTILKPLAGKKGPEAALIIVQGAQIAADKYAPLGEAIQQASPLKLWIALPKYPLDLGLPIGIYFEQPIKRVLRSLRDQGFSDSSPYVRALHFYMNCIFCLLWNGLISWCLFCL